MTLALALCAAFAAAAAVSSRSWRMPLRRRVQRSPRAIREDVPVLVDGLAAALGSGLSLPLAFAEVAPTLRPELAAATRRVAASLSLGATIPSAVEALCEIVPAADVAPLVIVLASFARSGGRVGDGLERVAALLRGRLALEEERHALTAQSRASATVLVSLAPLGAAFLGIAMPDYASTVIRDGLGLAALALAFEAVGALWLWRIVRRAAAAPDLASFLEAVVVGLDAGLTFERALAGLIERVPSLARAAEARRLLADLALGLPLATALRSFASGPEEARVAALVAASTRFGSPLAHVLVAQADALRATERYRAQAIARRLPVLMLFPLALCILPALLLVFLGPPLLTLLR